MSEDNGVETCPRCDCPYAEGEDQHETDEECIAALKVGLGIVADSAQYYMRRWREEEAERKRANARADKLAGKLVAIRLETDSVKSIAIEQMIGAPAVAEEGPHGAVRGPGSAGGRSDVYTKGENNG